MEVIATLAGSWPLSTLVIVVVALIAFRKPIIQFLQRAQEMGIGGFKVTSSAQEQRKVEPQPDLSKVDE